MKTAETARVDALRARLRAHGCKLMEASTGSRSYYLNAADGSVVTNKGGYPLTLAQVEEWEANHGG